MSRIRALIVLTALLVGALKAADRWQLPPENTKLKPGPGAALVAGNCLVCHSADYISTQPRLSRTAWTAAVEKMRTKYGAPIATNNIAPLVDYLTANYGAAPK